MCVHSCICDLYDFNEVRVFIKNKKKTVKKLLNGLPAARKNVVCAAHTYKHFSYFRRHFFVCLHSSQQFRKCSTRQKWKWKKENIVIKADEDVLCRATGNSFVVVRRLRCACMIYVLLAWCLSEGISMSPARNKNRIFFFCLMICLMSHKKI